MQYETDIIDRRTYTSCSTADRQPISTGKVDQLRDVVTTVHAGSEALWEDYDELPLLLHRSTDLHATDLSQLVR